MFCKLWDLLVRFKGSVSTHQSLHQEGIRLKLSHTCIMNKHCLGVQSYDGKRGTRMICLKSSFVFLTSVSRTIENFIRPTDFVWKNTFSSLQILVSLINVKPTDKEIMYISD